VTDDKNHRLITSQLQSVANENDDLHDFATASSDPFMPTYPRVVATVTLKWPLEVLNLGS
jgi:hypothetical protein